MWHGMMTSFSNVFSGSNKFRELAEQTANLKSLTVNMNGNSSAPGDLMSQGALSFFPLYSIFSGLYTVLHTLNTQVVSVKRL